VSGEVIFLIVCVVLALVLVTLGLLQCLSIGWKTYRRIKSYAHLPILAQVAATGNRLAVVSARADTLTVLAERARRAMWQIEEARSTTLTATGNAVAAMREATSFLFRRKR